MANFVLKISKSNKELRLSFYTQIALYFFVLSALILLGVYNNGSKRTAFYSEKKVQNRYVALSVGSQFSMRDSYMFYIPVTCLAWRRLGFEPIVIMVQPEHRPSQSYPSVSENTTRLVEELKSNLLKLKVIEYLNHLNVKVVYMNAPDKLVPFVGMLSRMFTAQLVDEYIQNDEDFIMMSDTDLMPVSRDYFLFNAASKAIKVWNAHCCGEFEYQGKNYTMHPMVNIGMTKKQWNELFNNYNTSIGKYGGSDKRSDSSHSIDSYRWTDAGLFKYKLRQIYNSSRIISRITDMFGNDYLNANLERGNDLWYTDQKMISILIDQYTAYSKIGIDKEFNAGRRLDRSLDFQSWHQTLRDRIQEITDAHLYGDEVFEDLSTLKALCQFIFDESVNAFIDKYVDDYTKMRSIYISHLKEKITHF